MITHFHILQTIATHTHTLFSSILTCLKIISISLINTNTRFMELELGLALPNPTPVMGKGLDLNSCSNEMGFHEKRDCNKYSHRDSSSVVDDDGEEVDSKSLPLLLWSGQPSDEDDAPRWTNLRVHDEENEEEDEEIMGWPPITSLRKELLHHHHGGGMAGVAPAPVRNYMYVKVKMEGVPIGRKIDLRLYTSYQSLTHSLINMFAKYIKNDNISNGNYTILYQDKEGDWMLAGDVPWETFVESVQRMEILRKAS